MTPPCPPAGAMMRRKQSVLLNISFCAAPPSRRLPVFYQSPFHGFCLDSDDTFVFFPVSCFQRKEILFHHPGSAMSVFTALHLFEVFLGRRFALPLALCPFLLFFFGIVSKLLCFRSPTGEILPHSSHVLVFLQHSPHHSTMRLLLHDRVPLPLCQGVYLFLPPELCLWHCWHKLVV